MHVLHKKETCVAVSNARVPSLCPATIMTFQQAAEDAANEFLRAHGMFCRACRVADYNCYPTVQGSRVRTIVHPETLQPLASSCVLLVLANNGSAWKPFISWLRRQAARQDTPDAFDTYTAHVVQLLMQQLESLGYPPLFWRQDTQTRPYTVIMQAAAHVSCMAHYEKELMWARHPEYAAAAAGAAARDFILADTVSGSAFEASLF
jgi:hypothetical protein